MNKTLLLMPFFLASAHAAAAVDTPYDDLVRQARAGNTTPVLTYLRQHVSNQTLQQREDHLVIASWAGLHQEVLDTYAQFSQPEQLSAELLATTARAHRNLGQYDQAITLFHRAHLKAPQDPQWVMGEMLALADGHKGRQAVAIAQPWLARLEGSALAEMRTVTAYALLSYGEHFEALHLMDQAYVSEYPGVYGREVLARYGQALSRSELPMAALEVDPYLTSIERLQKQADEMALRVQIINVDSRRESERFVATDEVLASYAALLEQSQHIQGAEGITRQMRTDRLGALDARGRYGEVIEEYEALRNEHEVPPYARLWVAHSLLAKRQPQRAEAMLASAIAEVPEGRMPWMQAHLLHIRALTESHRQEEALAEVNRLLPLIGRYRWVLNYPPTEFNSAWLALQLHQIRLTSDLARVEPARALGEELCRIHSDSVEPCITLADLYRANGWPRRGEQRLKLVENTAPRAAALEISQAYNAQELREWQQFDQLTADVAERFPEDVSVQRLTRANQVEHMAELRVSGGPGRSRGGSNRVRGSHSQSFDATLYSPRMANHWRALVGTAYSSSDFVDDRGRGRWQRAGVEYSQRNLLVESDVSYQDFSQGREMGYRLAMTHDLSDQWHWGALVAIRSPNAPLNARARGVHADQYQLNARWTPDDQREWQLALTHWRYSDGNRQQQLDLYGAQRIWANKDLRLDGLLNIGAHQSTDSQNKAYYSPDHDLEVLPSLRLRHRLHVFYENEWAQTFELGAGRYWQADHGSSPVLMARYSQTLQMNDVLTLGATLGWEQRAYDGQRERDLQLGLEMDYRF